MDEQLFLKNQLCFPLYATARKIVNIYTPLLEPLGITYTQYLVFLVLWEKDNVRVGELGDKLHLDNGTLTPLLKKLEKKGVLIRKRERNDERVVVVSLTNKGKALKEEAKNIPTKLASCINLSKEDAGMLYQLLYKVLNQ